MTMDAPRLDDYITRNCSHLHNLLDETDESLSSDIRTELLYSANPNAGAGRIEDLIAENGKEAVLPVLTDASIRHAFVATVAGSRFLASVLKGRADLLESVFARGGFRSQKDSAAKEADLNDRLQGVSKVADFDKRLRQFKDEEYLRIGCRDLAEIADVVEVMRELSHLARVTIAAALEFHWELLAARFGTPKTEDGEKGFVVLALGKLAGEELNLSSDVDLIYLRRSMEGRTDGLEKVPVTRFYETLARAVAKSLSDITEDGFVFRVDLRLRPEGDKGELVPSFDNAREYYLSWGRTWERAALMKAVPVAGDLHMGDEFLQELEPFIYRKFLDYSTIEEMREMKLKVQDQLRRKPGINIKLGQGGIREIEFFVQAIQLINAGKIPRVRTSSTLTALTLLEENNLLDTATAGGLRQAYLFFRKTEHRIQINNQLHTHDLPRTRDDQEELARRMGYRNGGPDDFLKDLDRHRKLVEELFTSMFYSSEEEEIDRIPPQVRALMDAIHDSERAVEILSDLGFETPAESLPLIGMLLSPQERRYFSADGRRLLQRLAPMLVGELIRLPEPGKALAALDSYIGSLRSTSTYFSTLLENPPTARFLVRLLGESRFFADLLIHHPQAIDTLIGRWTAQPPEERETLSRQLAERLSYCHQYEAALDTLRVFKSEQLLRVGVSHFNGEMDSMTARWLVTELAEVCLQAAVRLAAEEMERRFGPVEGVSQLPFVVLGMGKLGGREMNYLSDVDVIFIYDPPAENIGRFSAHEWFSRLAHRVISALSVPTSEGIVFEIDTRLRPSGNKGPLVSSLDSFREYHRQTSELWEKQALIKARPVTGPQKLRDQVAEITCECVLNTDIGPEDVAEVDRLRRRMEYELAEEGKGHVDLKTGYGGLVDVEFYVQAKILQHVRRHPDILHHNTLESLAALRSEGLVGEDDFLTLDKGYRFLINLEDRLRIMEHRSVDRIPLEGTKLRGLARRLGYEEGSEHRLVEDYQAITRAIRDVYNSVFAGKDVSDEAGG